MEAEALVVHTDIMPRFNTSLGLIGGSGQGALLGIRDLGDYGVAISIFVAPILLPVAAVIGANSAHSKDEVDAAYNAFNSVGQDIELLTSIDRRFVEALDADTAKHWTCIEAASLVTGVSCSGKTPIARIALRPALGLVASFDYDPVIRFVGSVTTSVSIEHSTSNVKLDAVVEAKWVYQCNCGKYFELAKDDADLLRNKLENILDRFAAKFAEDLYLAPRSEILFRKKNTAKLGIPECVVVRVEPGPDRPLELAL